MKQLLTIFFLLLGIGLYSQIDTIPTNIGIVYYHRNDPQIDSNRIKWVYVFDTGNKCFQEKEYIIDFITFSVPDRFLFYNGDNQNLIYDSGQVGSDCNAAIPGSTCRTGFFIRKANGEIVETFPPTGFMYNNPYYAPGRFNINMGFRVHIRTASRYIHMEALPNYRYRTLFHVLVHPPIDHNGQGVPEVHKTEYVCNEEEERTDTTIIGNPCETVFYTHYVFKDELPGLDWDTTVLRGSHPFIKRFPEWMDYIELDGLANDYIIFDTDEPSEVEIYVCNRNDCCGYGTLKVYIYEDDTYIPNVFSPNGDGINDLFEYYTKLGVINHTWQIFDRWGGLKYEGHEHWDGTFKGERCQIGVYVYVLKINYFTGHSRQFSGDVTIVR